MKAQFVVDFKSQQVICTQHINGKTHDFKLFTRSRTHMLANINALTDTGYLGMHTLHQNTTMPKKRSKNYPLSKETKKNNRKISQTRVVNEHVIGRIKRFRILAEKYRNRRKRFGLRLNLISGIYNYNLAIS
jgi:hypothetical protein